MTEMDCACAQQPTLWTTVENSVDKPIEKSQHAMSLYLTTKALDLSDTQEALIDALDVLTARVDALEGDIWTILGILNTRPTDTIERLRQIRAHLKAPVSEPSGPGASPQPNQEAVNHEETY